jgi:hypothetical protein
MLASELELFWFPTKALKQARRDGTHMLKAKWYDAMVHRMATAENISVADAKREVVALAGLHSVEGLEQYIKRARRKAKSRTKK